MERAESFDILQVEAKQKGHGESGAVIDQGRQVGQDEGRITAKQSDIEKRIQDLPFPEDEGNNQDKTNDDKPDPGHSGEGRYSIHDCCKCGHVKEGTFIVETFISCLGPFSLNLPQDEDQDYGAEGNIDQEYTPPAKMLGQEPAQKGPGGKAQIDRGDIDSKGAPSLPGRKHGSQDGDGCSENHCTTCALQQPEGNERI